MQMFRFSLRSIMFFTILSAACFAWRFQPYTLHEYWSGGELQAEREVRRTWEGEILTSGKQIEWTPTHDIYRTATIIGEPVKKLHLVKINWDYRKQNGIPTTRKEWVISVIKSTEISCYGSRE